jgi:predicted RND superfamily exporter protein
LKKKLLELVIRFCLDHPRAILLFSALLAVLSISALTRLSFDPDILNLIPQHNQAVNDFKKVINEMGTIDYHVVVIDIPEGHQASEYEGYIDALGQAWTRSTLTEDVVYRVPNPVSMIDELLPRAMLLLSPEEIDKVGDALTDERIREAVARNRALLQTPQATAMKDIVRWDPFNLLPVFVERFRAATGRMALDLSTGYYLSPDHRIALILAKPGRSAQDLPFAREIIAQSAVFEDVAASELHRDHPDLPLPKISYTGGYAIAFDDSELIKSDIIANVLFSFVGVLLIFLYGFRRFASVIYALVPMSLALIVTFGFAAIVYGELASASAGFAALLAGLGIDFIMLVYGRYVDERNRELSMAEALINTIRSTYPGVFIAAITTAATFYGFLATDFEGMTQLGFLTGTGIIFFFLSVTFVLPALLVLNEGNRQGRRDPHHFHHDFGSAKLIDFSLTHPTLVLALWSVAIVVFGILATQIHFSDRIQDLRSPENRGIVVQERLTAEIGQSFDFMMYAVEGATIDEVLEKTQQATLRLDPIVNRGEIASYEAISTFVPPVSRQMGTIEKLRAEADGRFSFERIETTFREALVANGFRDGSYDTYLELFRRALSPDGPMTIENLEDPELSRAVSRYVKHTETGYMSVIYLYAPDGYWGRGLPPAVEELQEKREEGILTGVNVMSGALREITRNDAIRSTTISFIAVLILIFIGFRRSIRMTILTFVPFGAGTIIMLGLMSALGLKFNFMNVFIGLMIIGVATDYAIYMLQRYLEDHETFTYHAHETGKAVVMAAWTSILGYGTFAISNYPGLRSIGYATTFGVGFSALAAITLLPAILTLKAPVHVAPKDPVVEADENPIESKP